MVHTNNIKYYLQKVLVSKCVSRCIKFEQNYWLKDWIDFNTEKRKVGTNDFEKKLFKLMNNAMFGKTMENVRSHIDFELVDHIIRLEKMFEQSKHEKSTPYQ